MSRSWLVLALVVAAVPVTLMSRTADWIASATLLLVIGVVAVSWIVRHILGELALNRDYDRPLEVAESAEAKR
jgi:hypothetical protein